MEARAGSPGLPRFHSVMHAMVSDPEEAGAAWAFVGRVHVDFHFLDSVVLPDLSISGLDPFSLSVYGVHVCCLNA